MNSRGDKGQYIVTDVKPCEGEEDYITFTWPFSRLVTRYRGYTKLAVCAVKTDESGTITAEWNTALAQMRVLEGLEIGEPEISPQEKDIIAQLTAMLRAGAEKSEAASASAEEAAERAQEAAEKLDIDSTLTQSGKAADAKSAGDRMSVLEKEYSYIFDKTVSGNLINPSDWLKGYVRKGYGNSFDEPQEESGSSCILIENLSKGKYVFNVPTGAGNISYGRMSTRTISGFVQVQDKGESGMYEYEVTSQEPWMVSLNFRDANISAVDYVYFARLEDYQEQGMLPFGADISFTDNLNGKVRKDMLEKSVRDSFDDALSGIYARTAEIKYRREKSAISYAGKIITSANTNFSVAEIELIAGETLTVYANSMTGDSSNLAMCEMFSDGSPLHKLYNAGDYLTSPMVHTAVKFKEYIYVMYDERKGLNAKISVSPEQLRLVAFKAMTLSYFNTLRYRYNSCICIGDSLTEGAQPTLKTRETYPAYLEKITGMKVTNAGQSGATAKSWWDTWKDTYNFADYECAVICLGTNGDVEEVGENYTAYLNIINKIKSDNPDCAVFLVDTIKDVANTTVKKIAEENNFAFIKAFENDFYWLRGMQGAAVTPVHDMEGDITHLSPMGYLFMAQNIIGGMCEDFVLNPQRYNQRHSKTEENPQ